MHKNKRFTVVLDLKTILFTLSGGNLIICLMVLISRPFPQAKSYSLKAPGNMYYLLNLKLKKLDIILPSR